MKLELTSGKNFGNKIIIKQMSLPPLFKLPKVTTFTHSKDGAIAQSFKGPDLWEEAWAWGVFFYMIDPHYSEISYLQIHLLAKMNL